MAVRRKMEWNHPHNRANLLVRMNPELVRSVSARPIKEVIPPWSSPPVPLGHWRWIGGCLSNTGVLDCCCYFTPGVLGSSWIWLETYPWWEVSYPSLNPTLYKVDSISIKDLSLVMPVFERGHTMRCSLQNNVTFSQFILLGVPD